VELSAEATDVIDFQSRQEPSGIKHNRYAWIALKPGTIVEPPNNRHHFFWRPIPLSADAWQKRDIAGTSLSCCALKREQRSSRRISRGAACRKPVTVCRRSAA